MLKEWATRAWARLRHSEYGGCLRGMQAIRVATGGPLLIALVAIPMVTACQREHDDFAPDGKTALTVSAIGHLNRDVGIPQYFINGNYFGNVSGWGGGGGTSCCVLAPADLSKPVVIHVRWQTCDTSLMKFENGRLVDLTQQCVREEHEADVPVHFADENGSTLYLHFLPDNRVEAWVSSYFPEGKNYPGPAYPSGSAPFSDLPDKYKASQPSGK